ncbi:MAG: tetratricopeptide repeat protein [ANME-2 cluster archaeon]|nr:MAG: tetratricopeptide repeat protein [ANME-2 cluster archaeon]
MKVDNKIVGHTMINPRVFISYSHDSQNHMDRILDFSNHLRSDGIDCNIDQYEISPPEGWPRWMTNQIEEADFVLIVCTENYEGRFKGKQEYGKGLGVKWEGAIINQEIYDAEAKNTKFIPVMLSSKDSSHIPVMLRGTTHYILENEEEHKALYRYLTNQPSIIKPEVGKLKPMPPRERKQEILKSYFNVPFPRNSFFTGREKVLDELHKSLRSNKSVALSQPLAISGLGGIGKTQTSVEYAYRYYNEYKTVFWAKADSREALISDYSAIAELLNLPEKNEADQNLSITATKRWLEENTDWLLILDNADNPEIIEDFLPLKFSGHILLTSRSHGFDNLGITNPIELDKMLPEEAKQFFLARTGHIEIEPIEIEAIESIALELEYLPLAMEQAGAYINKIKCSFQDYLQSYRTRGLALLEKSRASTGKYPESVATTWLLNFEQVMQKSPAAADLLCASAFLEHDKIPFEIISNRYTELGPALSTALENLESDPLLLDEVFEPLTQYSLLQRDSSTNTYNIHRLVQAVLKDGMDAQTQRLWSECVVKAVNCAFPKVEFSKWHLCDRILPHALTCSELIIEWDLEFQEAARLLNNTGFYIYKRARFEEAESLFNRALDISEKVLESDHPDVANILNNLANLYKDLGKYENAELLYTRALDIREKALGLDHPEVATILNNLAVLYHQQGKYEDAEPLHNRALNIREKALGPDHPKVANSLNNLAAHYHQQLKYDDAEPLYERALDISEKVLEPDHPDVAYSLINLAGLYEDQGKYDEAEPLLKRALDLRERVLEINHPDVAGSLNNLAALYHKLGKYDEAEPLYIRALDIWEKALGPHHPDVAKTLINLATLYHKQGKYAKANPLYLRSITIVEKFWGKEHVLIVTYLSSYSNFLRDINRNRESLRFEHRIKAIKLKGTRKLKRKSK